MAGFFLAGGMLFLLYGLLGDDTLNRVFISEKDINRMFDARQTVLGRSLTEQERQALRDSYVNNEILVREAVALGLHLEDSRIRKRLAEKMYYLFDRDIQEPTAEQLARYYGEHREQYFTPPTISFEHVYFRNSESDAVTALKEVSSGQGGGCKGRRLLAGTSAGGILCRAAG